MIDILTMVQDEQREERLDARQELLTLLQTSAEWTDTQQIHRALELAERAQLDPEGKKNREWVPVLVQAVQLDRQAGETIAAWQSRAAERRDAKSALDLAEKRRTEEIAKLDAAVTAATTAYHATLAGTAETQAATALRESLRVSFPPLFGLGDWAPATSVYSFPHPIQATLQKAGLVIHPQAWVLSLRSAESAEADADRRRLAAEEHRQAEIAERNAETRRQQEAAQIKLLQPASGATVEKVEDVTRRPRRRG